jgi:XTP/dITP diphosphohydrolase
VREFDCSAAELDAATKNRLSHRGQAMQKLIDRLPAL